MTMVSVMFWHDESSEGGTVPEHWASGSYAETMTVIAWLMPADAHCES